MKKSTLTIPIAIMLAILAVILVFMCLPLGQTRGGAASGILDLRTVDLSDSVYQLTGEWQYISERFCPPEDFPDDAPLIFIPKNWGGTDDYLNTYGTYRLIVHTNDSRLLTLYIPEIYCG